MSVDQSTNTITNQERPKTSVTVNKKWLRADGKDTPPENAKVTFELYADGKATGKTIELDGTAAEDGSPEKASNCYESAAWTAMWDKLPKYRTAEATTENEIKYTVKEVTGFSPFVNKNPEGVGTGGEITNEESSHSLKLIKQDLDDPTVKLQNATFDLYRIKNVVPSGSIIEHDGDKIDTQATDGNGVAMFSNLTEGYYEIKETSCPTGYIRDDDATFYIRVDKQGIHLISKDMEKAPDAWEKVASYSDGFVLEFAIEGNGEPAAVTLTNEKGAELPNSGGIGTTIFYILGSLLAIGCAVVMISRRRLRKN